VNFFGKRSGARVPDRKPPPEPPSDVLEGRSGEVKVKLLGFDDRSRAPVRKLWIRKPVKKLKKAKKKTDPSRLLIYRPSLPEMQGPFPLIMTSVPCLSICYQPPTPICPSKSKSHPSKQRHSAHGNRIVLSAIMPPSTCAKPCRTYQSAGLEVVDIRPTTPVHYPAHGEAAARHVASGDCIGLVVV
jgi:hypothetical protein